MVSKSRPTIMVIGEDSNFCYLMQRYIRQSAYHISFTDQGEKALELACREKPLAIFLEMDHPSSAGWTILRRFKSDERTSGIPVVLCSWKDSNSDERATDIKAEAYLRKPVLYEDFQAILRQLGLLPEKV